LLALIKGRTAVPAASGVAVEPVRAGADLAIIQASDYPSGWVPLIEALAHADSAHGADAWGEMKQAIRQKLLPMMGRADGEYMDFDPVWLNYLCRFGCSLPTMTQRGTRDKDGRFETTGPVGPGAVTDRPDSNDLWFDRIAATQRRRRVPSGYHDVVVSLEALRRLIHALRPSSEDTAEAPESAAAPELRKAADATRNSDLYGRLQSGVNGRKARGPRPVKRQTIMRRMIADYAGRSAALVDEKEVLLADLYSASRDTIRKARSDALVALNLDKLRPSTNSDRR
jgi:hypothetical protein